MPELAEVETTRRDLSKYIIGQKINKVEVFLDKIVYNKKDEFIKTITGQVINDVKRRGKWLLFELDFNYVIIHFRMEGRFYLKNKMQDKDKHDYVIFYLDDYNLHFNDPRLFGKLEVLKKDEINKFFLDKKLGLEYDDVLLTSKYLKNRLKTHHTAIKKILLDQSYVTGIGNIYADEILFRSKINPETLCDKLSEKKLELIISNMKTVFEESLSYKGTYPNIDGKRGQYEKHLLVHKRENEKCYNCGDIIKKKKVGTRGTYFCPTCQKKV